MRVLVGGSALPKALAKRAMGFGVIAFVMLALSGGQRSKEHHSFIM